MGILDSVSNAANRGVAAAGRTSRSVRLKMQADDLLKQRKDYAAQLGASLYEKTRGMPEMREGRESLYSAIEGIDRQRQEIAAELEAIEAAVQESEQAAQTYKCGKCGNAVSAADLYCSGCGRPVSEIKAEAAMTVEPHLVLAQDSPGQQCVCPKCGAPVAADDAFCMSCGEKLDHDTQSIAGGSADRPIESAAAAGLAVQAAAGSGAADFNAVGQGVDGPGIGAVGIDADGSAFGDAGADVDSPDDTGLGAGKPMAGLSAAYSERINPQEAEPSTSPVCCAQCGAPVSPEDVFCGNCGRKV